MITRAALEYPFFREAFSTLAMTTTYWGTGESRYWRTKNKLFNPQDKEYYEHATGGKTGWTSAAGSCLISAAAKDGQELISVILKSTSTDQWCDTRSMFEYGFNNYKYTQLFKKGTIIETLPLENYDPGDWGSLAIEIGAEDFGDLFLITDIPQLERSITWDTSLLAKQRDEYDTQPRLLAPLKKGQEVGRLTYTLNGRVVASSPLLASRDVKERKPTIIERIIPEPESVNFSGILKTVLISMACLIFAMKMLVVIVKFQRRRRQRYIFRR
jgi:D-alanyl-D-alanine carboxypeptidase (penicillin-binding protein 5/6)